MSIKLKENFLEYRLSKNQQGIYVETMSHPGTTIYNTPVLVEVHTSIDEEKLKSSVIQAINAHPFCKTRLSVSKEGEVFQKCMDDDKSYTESSIETFNVKSLEEITFRLVKPFNLFGQRLFNIALVHLKKDAEEQKRYLFLDFHHIICDGISYKIFIEDISKAYSGIKIQKEKFSGFDFVLLEEKKRRTRLLKKSKNFYKNLFAGLEAGCPLEGDILEKKSEILLEGPGIYKSELKYSNAKEIEVYCKKNHLTKSGFYTAAFGFLLAVFSDSVMDDIVFASIYKGRKDSRLQNTFAMLVKTFPILCRFSKDHSEKVCDFIRSLSKQVTKHIHYGIYSFAEICHEYGITSDILFAWQGNILTYDTFCNKPTNFIELSGNQTKAALNVQLFPASESQTGLRIYFEFDKSRFSKEFVQNLSESYDMILSGFIKEEYLKDVNFLSENQLFQLDSFNNTKRDYEKTDIVSLFSRQAKLTPENIAVIYNQKKYTYREVDDLSDRLAACIQKKGIQAGEIIPVLAARNEYMVIASLGVLKAGCAYQPLTSEYPKERLSFMVSDSKARLMISDSSLIELAGTLGNFSKGILNLDILPSLPKSPSLKCQILPQDLFILLYTSGTSGTPKGVMLTHKNLSNFCHWYRTYYELQESSVVAAYASYGFDACMMDLYPALTKGAAVCIVPQEMRLNLFEVNKYFKQNNVTHSFMTTLVGRQFATEIPDIKLKHLSIGGESLVPLEASGNLKLYNPYGPTECTIFSTIFPIEKAYRKVPIGKALFNTKIYIINKLGQRLPGGASGELCISGHGVGKGYFNNPEKTKKAFAKNPFSDEKDYEIMYKTGDIARILLDGNIDFIGRNDNQVKIRGFRIELTEIEEVIIRYEDIKDVTVQAFDFESGEGKFIAAYIVSERKIDKAKLCDFIASQKPSYMIPSFIMQIEKIPLTQNQKVNKKALPLPERSDYADKEIIPPSSEKEIQLQKIWAEILGIDKKEIGINSNFFELGGDSIRAIMLVVQYEKKMGISITPAEIFRCKSISSQLQLISRENKVSDIYVYNKEKSLPNVYFVHTGHTGGEAYVNLSPLLSSVCSLRCFEPNNVFHPENQIHGIKNLSAKYIELLKEDQKEGPYILGGWSYGGMIAYEMACQLEKNGDEVSHLFLLDPDIMTNEQEKEIYKRIFTADNFDDYLKKDPLFERFRKMGLLEKTARNSKIVLEDMLSFVPENYNGPVTFFKSKKINEEDALNKEKKDLFLNKQKKIANGYEKKIKNLTIIPIDADHDSFMQGEALIKIADVIRKTLEGGR